MSRNSISLALTVALAVFGLAGGAAATSCIDMVWTGGSPTVTVTADTTLTGHVVMTADSAGITGMGISFVYDTNLNNELDWTGLGKETPGVK
jgi:hypothetical protein